MTPWPRSRGLPRPDPDHPTAHGDITLSGTRPERVLDPVCGMTVDVATAEAAGLTLEHEGRTFAFCGSGCLRAFREEPNVYAATSVARARHRHEG